MKLFSPPFRYAYPRFDNRDVPAARRVQSYFNSSPEGISVYVLTDGTVTQVAPTDSALIRHWYRGGYVHEISDDEAAVLAGAGYTVTNPTTGVIDYTPAPPVSRPQKPITWDDLSAYTWDQARQFLWGDFHR